MSVSRLRPFKVTPTGDTGRLDETEEDDVKGQADYVRRTYGVPAKRGGRVTVDGRPGVITSFRHGKLRVRFDGLCYSIPAHPTWRVEYLPAR